MKMDIKYWKKKAEHWKDKAWETLDKYKELMEETLNGPIRVVEEDFEDVKANDYIIVTRQIGFSNNTYSVIKQVKVTGTTWLHDHNYIKTVDNCKYYEHEYKGKVKVVIVK